MNGVMNNPLNISSSPHARDRWTTAFIMRLVILALLPTTIIGCVYNGIHATLVVLFGVVTAVLLALAAVLVLLAVVRFAQARGERKAG